MTEINCDILDTAGTDPFRWSNILAFFAVVVLYKLCVNIYYGKVAARVEARYQDLLSRDDGLPAEISEDVRQIISRAGIKDIMVPFTQPGGYGILKSGVASALNNLNVKLPEVTNPVRGALQNAISTFKYRTKQALNPFYWIELIVLAPIKLLKFVGFDEEKTAVKLLGAVLNIIWVVLCVLTTKFRTEIIELIRESIS